MKELTKPEWVVDYEKFQEEPLVIGSDNLARCSIQVWNSRIFALTNIFNDHLARCLIPVWNSRDFSLTNIFNIKMLLVKIVLLVWREINSKNIVAIYYQCSRCALWKSESKHSLYVLLFLDKGYASMLVYVFMLINYCFIYTLIKSIFKPRHRRKN